ncbi:MAG: Rieske 2Fe-2S domain-containing protein [Nitrososphaerales archaeon]|nr:Rieske 2Fe-2S domain-containing protein [Nitrososphaerales archaeon]
MPPAEDGKESGQPDARRPMDEEVLRQKTSRRDFVRVALAFGVVLLAAGIASITRSLLSPAAPPPQPTTITSTGSQTGTVSSSPFPRVKAANVGDLAGGKTVSFNYPLQETPNLLAKLGKKAKGGVGPDGDIVAFSQVCQHLGCIYGFVPAGRSPSCDQTYQASGPVGYCCCHGSVFDLVNGANVVAGPAPRPVPQVMLEYDESSGNIYAVGMLPPTIFGHNTGSDDVLYDLQGGTLVS